MRFAVTLAASLVLHGIAAVGLAAVAWRPNDRGDDVIELEVLPPEPRPPPPAPRADRPPPPSPAARRPRRAAPPPPAPLVDIPIVDEPETTPTPVVYLATLEGDASASGPPGSAARGAGSEAPLHVEAAATREVAEVPRVLAEVRVPYPPDLEAAGVEGRVRLRVEVLADGRVGRVEFVAGEARLRAAATGAMRRFRFAPARDAAGRPMPFWIPYDYVFELPR